MPPLCRIASSDADARASLRRALAGLSARAAGIEAVLRGLSELAHAKAERTSCNWSDKPLAGRWTTLAIGGLAPKALGL